LVLLGDRDQLASVQAGAVLGDVCAGARGFRPALAERLEELAGPLAWRAPAAAPALSDCLVPLQRSYRYDAAGGLGRLAVAVRDGDAGAALAALDAGEQVGWGEAGSAGLAAGYQAYRAAVRGGQPPEAVLAAFDRYRVLAALRAGPRGVEALNRSIEQALGLARERRPGSEWYAGRPVMITRNHYGLGLYNGDVGVALADAAAGGELRVFFQQPGAGLRALPPLRLPEHETVYATTVHKSQGSELEAVAVVLPEQPGAAATRELLYTAITRARSAVRVWASRQALSAAVAQPTRRSSGLREALWGA
jgi:exodeoxyribonuclease V alpha subunit